MPWLQSSRARREAEAAKERELAHPSALRILTPIETGNDEIDEQLKRERMVVRNQIKMLLVGAGNAGQSEIMASMKRIHQVGYSDNERDAYRGIVYSTVIQFMRTVLDALPVLNLSLQVNNETRRDSILNAKFSSQGLSGDVAGAIRHLWCHDPAIQSAVRERACEFNLDESAIYFFNAIKRIGSPNYLPSDQDIERLKAEEPGINETAFKIGELEYKVFDAAAQRSDRRKWIHFFEDITALIFVVNLTDYSQALDEDNSMNCIEDALALFDSICNSPWFLKTSIILMLNNIDAFSERLPHAPLNDYFPDYTGGDDNDAACDYLLDRFVSLNQSAATRQIYAHFTSRSDTTQLKFILNATQDILLQLHLQECGRV